MELKGKKINFLGDSITEGCSVSVPENYFWNVIGREQGATVRGYGIGGTRIARQKNPTVANPRQDLDFCMRVDEMDPDADIIVVFGGTNDWGHGDAPLGTPADRTPDTFYGACHTLCRKLIEKYPAAVIAFMTPLHRETEDDLRGGQRKPADVGNLLTYVRIIREVTEEYSLPTLDLYACSGMQPKIKAHKELYMPDGLHPNDAGHAVIARKLTNFLLTL